VVPISRAGKRPQVRGEESVMTTKAQFSDEEWKQILEGPPSAGMIVITAAKGGMFRETWAMSKVYAEARRQHGTNELLDAIVAAKPEMDHSKYRSPEELRTACLQHLRDAVAVLEGKAEPDDLAAYRQFVQTVAERVAEAHKENGKDVSAPERQAIEDITTALGSTGQDGTSEPAS
jgi:hypothetical protein